MRRRSDRAELAVTVVVRAVDFDVGAPWPDLLAPLQRALRAAVGAAHQVERRPLKVEAILHLHGHGAAESIEAEGRIVADDLHRLHGLGRDQVPVDRVAEGFVDAHAVLIDGQALRRTLDRRGGKAAEVKVGLQVVAGDGLQLDARRLLVKRLNDAGRLLAFDLLGIDLGHCGGYFRHVDARSGDWRSRDDVECRQFDHGRPTAAGRERLRARQNDAARRPRRPITIASVPLSPDSGPFRRQGASHCR